jgi:fatty-acid desaturase
LVNEPQNINRFKYMKTLKLRTKEPLQWAWVSSHVVAHFWAFFGLQYFSFQNLMLMLLVHYVIILFGITIGYHRLFAHRTFETSPAVEFIFGLIGVLAFQGGPAFWSAVHRSHHGFTDDIGDAHSAKRGFWWAHQGWLMRQGPNGFSLIANRKKIVDITKSPHLMFLENNFLWLNILIAGSSAFILPLETWFWVFPVRIVFGWHVTWTVNSFAHGLFPFGKIKSPRPKNVSWISFLTCGEGLHENHHEDPNNVSFEKTKIDFDFGYRVLKIFSTFKIISFRNLGSPAIRRVD